MKPPLRVCQACDLNARTTLESARRLRWRTKRFVHHKVVGVRVRLTRLADRLHARTSGTEDDSGCPINRVPVPAAIDPTSGWIVRGRIGVVGDSIPAAIAYLGGATCTHRLHRSRQPRRGRGHLFDDQQVDPAGRSPESRRWVSDTRGSSTLSERCASGTGSSIATRMPSGGREELEQQRADLRSNDGVAEVRRQMPMTLPNE